MRNWYQILSLFFTNGLRIVLGLYFAVKVLKLSVDPGKAAVLSACLAVFVTMLSCFSVPFFLIVGTEILLMMLLARYLFHTKMRMFLFLIFFYEITIALWDFIVSAGLGVLFRSEGFLDPKQPEHMAAVWIVRLLMTGTAFLAVKTGEKGNGRTRQMASAIAMAGLFSVIFLSGQSTIAINDEQLTTWIIFAMLILVAVLFFYLSSQYEMEKKIACLEKEKNGLLMRDYQLLKDTYAANAKMFHDFNNHMEAVHRYLTKDMTEEALRYLEDLRFPQEAVTQSVWTGDEAADCLINSKIALAKAGKIQVNCKIEYPRHTNIRSVDLVAILGNLLDNALEAARDTEGSLRFISLTIRRINEMLIIKLENGCKAAPTIEEGELKTTKQDTALHGWGLKSVRTAAERYDGTVETEYGGNRFCTVVTLSYEPVKAGQTDPS